LLQGDDTDLLSVGTDETDWTQTDLLVDTGFIVDATLPPLGF